jgi:23S rRNA pseudouridine1911/1915/1917 synthase
VERRGQATALVRCVLETGRTHQIRVHLANDGHPIVGDPLYGGPTADRLMLHATRLTWRHRSVGSRPPFESIP